MLCRGEEPRIYLDGWLGDYGLPARSALGEAKRIVSVQVTGNESFLPTTEYQPPKETAS